MRDEHECPICQSTLTYEPLCADETEHLVLNRYYLLYTVKNAWFSLLCCIWGIIRLFTAPFSPLWVPACILCLLCLLISVFQWQIASGFTHKYSEEYAPFKVGLIKFSSGAISALLFLIS